MNDKATIIPAVMDRLERLQPGQCLDMRTYKRNRSVVVACTDPGVFLVMERGFHEETWQDLDAKEVKRLLKTLLKREFPRSHKIRLYMLDSFEQADVNRMGHGAGRFGA